MQWSALIVPRHPICKGWVPSVWARAPQAGSVQANSTPWAFWLGYSIRKSIRTGIQGKFTRGIPSLTVKATEFTCVEKSQPETRDCSYINPTVLLLLVMVIGAEKYSAETQLQQKVRRWKDQHQGGCNSSTLKCKRAVPDTGAHLPSFWVEKFTCTVLDQAHCALDDLFFKKLDSTCRPLQKNRCCKWAEQSWVIKW